jgi:hypothetical protein
MSSTVAAPVVLSLLHGIRADRLNRIFTLDLIQYIRQVSAIILRPGGTCGAFSDGGLFFSQIGWAWSDWPTVLRITSAKNANDKITKCNFRECVLRALT